MSKAISLTGLSEFLKKCKEIFAEKEEKYIIIDWEGKDENDADKKAEVDARLKNIYLANPLALLSVLFKNYGENASENTYFSIVAVAENVGENSITIAFYEAYNNAEVIGYTFSIE